MANALLVYESLEAEDVKILLEGRNLSKEKPSRKRLISSLEEAPSMEEVSEEKENSSQDRLHDTLIEVAESNPHTKELDLHGMDLHEAEQAVDVYLDREFRQGTPVVKITYGVGTGRLASEIPEFLKKHPLVLKVKAGKGGGIAAYAVLNI